MALLKSNMVKTFNVGKSLQYTANAKESVLVKDIHIFTNTATRKYATISVGDATRGYFRISGALGNHLPYVPRGSKMKTILRTLFDKKIWSGYPLGPGKKITISSDVDTQVSIEYDVYDENDIRNDMPNGEKAKEYTYLAYGGPENAISSSGIFKIGAFNNPQEMPLFPFKDTAPEKEMIVHGVCYSARGADDGTNRNNFIETVALKIMRGEHNLFDEDKIGLPAISSLAAQNGGFNAENGLDIGGEGTILYQKTPLFFDRPLVFQHDEGLDTYWNVRTAATPGTFLPEELEISYILTKKEM